MTREIYYDDSNLMKLFESLEPKRRNAAMRAAIKAASRDLRKAAVKNFRASVDDPSKYSESGIRALSSKQSIYYRVTVGTKKQKMNYSGMSAWEAKTTKFLRRKAIVPLWLEGGTVGRKTKGQGFLHRGAHSTGSIKPHRFMEKTKREQDPIQTENLRRNIEKYIEKTAVKYGAFYS